MIDERIRIEYAPISPRATAVSGSTRWRPRSNRASTSVLSPPGVVIPEVGNQPRPAAKMMISGMPMTKYGIE